MKSAAGMAKLADAADLKSAGAKSPVGVRFPLPAPANPSIYAGFTHQFGLPSFSALESKTAKKGLFRGLNSGAERILSVIA